MPFARTGGLLAGLLVAGVLGGGALSAGFPPVWELPGLGPVVLEPQEQGSMDQEPAGGDPFPIQLLLPPEVPGLDDARVVVPGDPLLKDRLRIVHWEGGQARAHRAMALLERNPWLPALPREVPARAVIFLAPDPARFDALTGGRVPHWGAGVAIPSLDRIVIPLFANPWTGRGAEDRTLLHEWAHLGLHDHLQGLRIPRWFDEGYAQWSSGGWDRASAWRLRLTLAGGGAPPLDSISLAWPRERGEAETAYLLAATALSYLVEGSGERGLELFLTRWRELGSFEEAFRRTFGITTGTFERQWLEHVKRRFGWLLILSQSFVFWILLGGVLLVLFRIRRRRDRERMARLRATEPPDLPAWWGPPPHPPFGGFPGERRGEVDPSRPGG
jgi:hypothetical protein